VKLSTPIPIQTAAAAEWSQNEAAAIIAYVSVGAGMVVLVVVAALNFVGIVVL